MNELPSEIEDRLQALEAIERGKLETTHASRREKLTLALREGIATADLVIAALDATLAQGPRGIVSGPPPALTRQQRRHLESKRKRAARKKGGAGPLATIEGGSLDEARDVLEGTG